MTVHLPETSPRRRCLIRMLATEGRLLPSITVSHVTRPQLQLAELGPSSSVIKELFPPPLKLASFLFGITRLCRCWTHCAWTMCLVPSTYGTVR